MSTYNGERYVVEQLASILQQLPPGGRILVRDDGSSDNTPDFVTALGDPRIEFVRGMNLGFGPSFLTLLTMAPADSDMVMFADQDDVWLPGKIDRAWQHLQPVGLVPALYGSAQLLTDANLQPRHVTCRWRQAPSFRGALVENMVTGCTAALNGPALRLLQRAGVADDVHFHDWWLYLVVSAFGRVMFDPEPTLLYRQHGSNQIGHGSGWLGRQCHVVRFLVREDWVGILLGQVHALYRHYGNELSPETRALVTAHFDLSPKKASIRWRLILSLGRWRDNLGSEFALRLLLALFKLRLWPRPVARRVITGQ